jgi:hypothetical protein
LFFKSVILFVFLPCQQKGVNKKYILQGVISKKKLQEVMQNSPILQGIKILTQKVSLLTKKIKFNKVFGMCSAYMMELCGVYEGIVN